MAFSKMVGLEVMPRSPSSSIIFCSSPESIMPRRMLSSQKLWPWVCSSLRGFISGSLSEGEKASAAQGRQRLGHDVVDVEPELVQDDLARGGGPETVDGDQDAVRAGVFMPAERGGGLDDDAGAQGRGQDFL